MVKGAYFFQRNQKAATSNTIKMNFTTSGYLSKFSDHLFFKKSANNYFLYIEGLPSSMYDLLVNTRHKRVNKSPLQFEPSGHTT